MKTLLSGLLLAASLSFAAPLTYNNYIDWAAAGSVLGTTSFNAVTPVNSNLASYTDPYGTIYTVPTGSLIAYSAGTSFTNLNGTQSLTAGNGSFTITLPANVFGFGFYIGSALSTPVDLYVNGSLVTSGSPQSFGTPASPAFPAPAGVFWGYRGDVAITTIQLVTTATEPGYRTVIDDFSISGEVSGGGGGGEEPPTETPEASSAILIGTSLILLPLARKYALRHKA